MRVAALLLTLLAVAAPAGAQSGNPFAPLPTPPQEPTPTVVAGEDGSDGLERWQELLIFGGGAIMLGGIAWVIISDARRRAPVSEGQAAHPVLGHAPKRNRSQKQRERARAAAKEARRQRKRTRRR